MAIDSRPFPGKMGAGSRRRAGLLLLAILLLLASCVYAWRSDPAILSDDEGNYAYAAWRISQGEVPYRDFLTSQMPGFLYWGGLVVRAFGRSIVPLRLATMAATLATACLLYALGVRLFDPALALLAVAFFLLDGNVYQNARLFRPEAYMLFWAMAGLYAFALGEQRRSDAFYPLAGLCFGLSISNKLFGVLLLAGCYVYLLYAWWRERRPLRRVLRQAVGLGLPAVAVVGLIVVAFSLISPYFLTAVYTHHAMQGAGLPVAQRVVKALRLYADLARAEPLLLLPAAVGVWALWRRRQAAPSLLLWQVPTALGFLVLSRELFVRHLTYLAPTLATLAAVGLCELWRRGRRLRVAAPVLGALALCLPLAGYVQRPELGDQETVSLATLIGQLTTAEEQVVSDYTGFCFAAGRPSTYWGAEISGGAVGSGQIRGTALIDDIERGNVSAVVINTLGRGRQLVDMIEYAEFRRYVQAHFALVAKVPSGYRQFEVYARRDAMPLQPGLGFHGEVTLTGLRLVGEVAPGDTLGIDARWQAAQPMSRDYHVSWRLVDGAGNLWAQADARLMEESSRSAPLTGREIREQAGTSQWAPGQVVLQQYPMDVPQTVPPGNYYLIARLYDPAAGIALPPGRGEGARLPGGDVPIMAVQVLPSAALTAPEAPPMAELQADLAEGLSIVAAGLPTSAGAGRDLGLSLLWRAPVAPAQDYRLGFSLSAGQRVLQQWTVDVAPGLPAGRWRAGEVVLGSYLLPLPAELPEGMGVLSVQALDGAGQPVGAQVELVHSLPFRPRLSAAGLREDIRHPLQGVSFGEGIGLLGYSLAEEALQPGESLDLTLYWECLQPPDVGYKVFVHLLSDDRQIQGQSDAIPGNGDAPTSDWRPGEALADRYTVPLRPEAPAGTLQVAIGFYDPVTGRRLPLLQDGHPTGQDYFILPAVVGVR